MNTDMLCPGKTLEDTNWGNRGFSETEVNLTKVDDLFIFHLSLVVSEVHLLFLVECFIQKVVLTIKINLP